MTTDSGSGDPPTAETLARLLAHDLRTPLNAVRGFADLLLAGAGGPVAAAQIELLSEIARAGRALELSVGLAQEVGEQPEPPPGAEESVSLDALLAECGFSPTAVLPGVAPRGDPVRWRRLLQTCHAHLVGEVEPAEPPSAKWLATADGRLELVMERHDIDGRWQTSVLREQLIRQRAASLGMLLASRSPHMPVHLRLGGDHGGANSA